ncbi:MAG: hypothetical protein ACLUPF_12980 [Dorea sp.]
MMESSVAAELVTVPVRFAGDSDNPLVSDESFPKRTCRNTLGDIDTEAESCCKVSGEA